MKQLFNVDYKVSDVEAFKASGVQVPNLIIADSFSDALAKAQSFESDNLTLRTCALAGEGVVSITNSNNLL